MKVRTNYNFNPVDALCPASSLSVTLPDQSLSIKEIVKRFTLPIPTDVNVLQGSYYPDQSDEALENAVDPDSLDLVELMELRDRSSAVAAAYRSREQAPDSVPNVADHPANEASEAAANESDGK